ncbi:MULTISPECIES: transcriptional regulator BolA [Vibrio]|uniref:DNA-binding transcriptional regulator BolA n=1 Tax=Vibrio algicola TaxID=2662262 RepID=A0A5Q0TCW3_9VIBR|nr:MULTISPECIES: transcriptional regulator BolA [Vibrio]MBD1575051.1 transcriptional regulator BolA [Vibrio sp. S11_S32]
MIQDQVEKKLHLTFNPIHLQVINESYMHNVPAGSESHFKVVVVSEQFEGKRLLMRHRAINSALADELANHIHALSINAYTDSEWKSLSGIPESPKCAGGGK